MSRFGNQWKNDVMNRVTKILILTFCAVLALSSCRKNRHTPVELDQPVSVGFSAVSQTAAVKSVTKAAEPLSKYHDDFGVWGIARNPANTSQPVYMLWNQNSLVKVEKSQDSEIYVPERVAFWLSGYTYDFLALAPYNDTGVSGLSVAQATPPAKDALSFIYDISSKYTDPGRDYEYNLMGAAAQNTVDKASTHTSQQVLTFWHLFTKLCVKVSFEGVEAGTLTGMRLVNVDYKTNYTISLDSGTALSVTSTPDGNEQLSVPFSDFSEETTTDGKHWQTATVHVVPQDISDWKLFLDFEITTEDDETASTSNFEVNLANAKSDSSNPNRGKYAYNEWYNWNITISPKIIKFTVSVTPWADYTDTNGDLNFDIQ